MSPTGQSADVPWTTEFCQMKKKEPGIKNIYMELGSTFGQLVTTNPTACAHLLGQVVDAFGADHVLWGTDSIWYGTPQWQIEAFRRFEIPPALVEKHGYAPLTRPVKEQIFGLNAARVFGVDVNAKRNEIPKDYLSRMKMAYLEERRRAEPPLVRLGHGLTVPKRADTTRGSTQESGGRGDRAGRRRPG